MNDNGSVVQMPPRNAKQALIAQMRRFIDFAEADKITGFAAVALRPGDDPANPPSSYFTWRSTLALSGAAAVLASFVIADIVDGERGSDNG